MAANNHYPRLQRRIGTEEINNVETGEFKQ